jgi:hypothetical protein
MRPLADLEERRAAEKVVGDLGLEGTIPEVEARRRTHT